MDNPAEKKFTARNPISSVFGRSLNGVSRRTALQHAVAVGACAAFSSSAIFAGEPPVDAPHDPGRVDVHHHMLPPFYMDLRRAAANMGVMPTWSPAKSLEDMEKSGVKTALLSLAVSGVSFDA